ncbi:MFS transporter [Bradyrhizobium sp. ISRA443]|uniref:MFS transporter n=1 Tax=unclassified Bradyrhizobium TaxID=2631580 RepID=UPI00247A8FAA|nr:MULTISPECIES: MFS transporter [unclassified Bradyrhizobium]WGR91120.1 MFS transporter [Bradyrhizobium sp. ISRA435]WGS01296.1 MFS transporter [Bradyrhizobium sp. ISRA436]WGS08183.1 MFS transporter [Bradyrhizobium sp. ISRA437]WGS15071.1 MFS transporter [Bradyrhizobium sp. ISRA443]
MLEKTPTAGAPSAPKTDGLPWERRRWAVAAIFTALAMASLDTAIANIALPAIANDLHVSPAEVVWVVNVYQIALVATLLPLGALGEIVGHQRIYLGGLLLFTVASLGCALAWSLPSLLVARTLQGLGASGLMSVNTALVRFVYPSRMHGRGFGHNALVVATAFTLGPTIASGILALGPWPWLFAVNIPFGLIAVVIGLKTLPPTPRATHAFDFLGAALASACLGLFITGIGSAAHKAAPALVIAELVGALAFGWILTRRHADHPAPMLPIDLFRRPVFALSAATAICSFAVQGLGFVSLPFYFEDILHRSQVETGFLMTPWPLVVAIMAPIGGRLSDRYPAGTLGGIGLLLLGIGMMLLSTLPAEPSIANIVWRMMICGLGFGFFQTPNMKAIMSSAPTHRSGSASGIVATARLIGQTTGAALAALCFAIADREGATLALALGAGFAAVGSVMSFLRLAVTSPKKA